MYAPRLVAVTKFKTTKINFEGLFGLSMKIRPHENYPPYGNKINVRGRYPRPDHRNLEDYSVVSDCRVVFIWMSSCRGGDDLSVEL